MTELRANSYFPFAVKSGEEEEIPLTVLYYLWRFSPIEEDFVPVGVFNTKTEAEETLAKLEGKRGSEAILSLTWAEFTSMAARVRLGKMAEALEKLKVVI